MTVQFLFECDKCHRKWLSGDMKMRIHSPSSLIYSVNWMGLPPMWEYGYSGMLCSECAESQEIPSLNEDGKEDGA